MAEDVPEPEPTIAVVEVLDTLWLPRRKAIATYRELLSTAYMPWSPTVDPEADFRVRMEVAALGDVTIARHLSTPHSVIRTASDVAKSEAECVHLLLILSGHHHCEQQDRETVTQSGDVLIVDSARPTRVDCGPEPHDVLTVSIPKEILSRAYGSGDLGSNIIIGRNRLPFSNLLSLLADRLGIASKEELSCLSEACISLLPLALGRFGEDDETGFPLSSRNPRFAEISGYVSRNLFVAELSARYIAYQFGISDRYLHKLFATQGITCNRYIQDKRLERVCAEFLSRSKHHEPIATVAERWGFRDVSTFNRAFRQKYGCTPSQYRKGYKG
jgi:AraC family transcriptional regulator, positive regulator of tynA and feaB